MRGFLVGVAVLAGAVGAACNPLEPRSCTLIGCASGLTVQLEGGVGIPYTIAVTAEGEEGRSIGCSEETGCELFFQDFTPGQVTVTYQTAGMLVERTFAPEYARSQPNGEGCPPVCLNATVVLEVPVIGAGRLNGSRD